MKRLLAAIAALALLALPAGARLAVNNLSSFGSRPVAAAGGGTPVVFEAGTAYVDSTEAAGTAPFEYKFEFTHTKDPDTTMLLVAISEPGENDNTTWLTPGTGSTVSYCGAPMTYVTASQAFTNTIGFDDNDDFHVTWWWLRGPSAGSCTLQWNDDELGAGTQDHNDGSGGTGDPPADVTAVVLEFSQVISSGDPFDAVTVVNADGGVTGDITLTPSGAAKMAIWAAGRDGNTTIGNAPPTVNFGTVDGHISSGTAYATSGGHYDAVGSKSMTITWGAGVSRTSGISGMHLKPNP